MNFYLFLNYIFLLKNDTFSVCNSLDECILHELYHVKQTEHAFANVVRKYNDMPGVNGISETAKKDMLEALSEAGVLRDKGMYGMIPSEAREQLDEAAKELELW